MSSDLFDSQGRQIIALDNPDGTELFDASGRPYKVVAGGINYLGRTATLVVAAANATDDEKAQANVVCNGTELTGGDEEKLNLLSLNTDITNIVLLGDFYFSDTWTINTTMKRVNLSGHARLHNLNIEGHDLLHIYGSASGSFDAPYWTNYASEMHITIKDLDFYGNANSGAGITTNNLWCVLIENCNIAHHGGIGLKFINTMRQTIVAFNSIYNNYDAINSTTSGFGHHQFNIFGNHISGHYHHSIYFLGPFYNVQIVGNDIEYCVGSHVKFDGSGSGEGESSICGNHFDGGDIGINAIHSQGINVVGNKFSQCNSQAIRFYGGSNLQAVGNQIRFCGAVPIVLENNPMMVTVSNNNGYIFPGEIRTYSGTIANLSQNAFNSLDNPFGQKVRVLSLDVYVSAGATSTSPNLDCGVGSSASADYTTLFNDLPGETAGFYRSTIAPPGTQTVPVLWDSGAGNRYLNLSIKDAAATGMEAVYTITIMGI